MIEERHIYTREEVTSFLKISKSTFMRMVKKDLIRAFKIGSQYRVLGSDILKLISPKLERKVQNIYRQTGRRLGQIKEEESDPVAI
jgi:excisionase family DNA binding protein